MPDGSIVEFKAIPDCDFAFAAAILHFCKRYNPVLSDLILQSCVQRRNSSEEQTKFISVHFKREKLNLELLKYSGRQPQRDVKSLSLERLFRKMGPYIMTANFRQSFIQHQKLTKDTFASQQAERTKASFVPKIRMVCFMYTNLKPTKSL